MVTVLSAGAFVEMVVVAYAILRAPTIPFGQAPVLPINELELNGTTGLPSRQMASSTVWMDYNAGDSLDPTGGTMATRPSAQRAFTLLELLVVVAVITLLLALLLPALSLAHASGQSVVCASDLTQLSHGSFAYSEDFDDRLPHYSQGKTRTQNRGDQEWWVTQVARGIDQFEPGIYRCPSDTTPINTLEVYLHNGIPYFTDGEKVDYPINPFTLYVSYRGFCALVEYAPPGDRFHGRRRTSLSRPDKAMEMVEGSGGSAQECATYGELSGLAGKDPRKKFSVYESWERHIGATNVLFMDGHVAMHWPPEIGNLAIEYGIKRNY